MEKLFREFGELLKLRIEKEMPTSEDSIRYTFFHAAFLTRGITPDRVELEGEFAKGQKSRMDALLLDRSFGRIAVEFKYHRKLQTPSSRPRPQQAGSLVRDMRRLCHFQPASLRLLVYLTDSEMSTYLAQQRNHCDQLFNLEGKSIQVSKDSFRRASATFLKSMGEEFECVVTCKYKQSLPRDHELRIWDVAASKAR